MVNLEELGAFCTALDETLAAAVETVESLSKYAARFRYPGAPWEPTLQEAEGAIQIAQAFFDTILQRIPPLADLGKTA